MALSTYADLKTTIASMLIRSDLTAVIPDFIRLAEARLNRLLKCRDMRAVATLTVVAGSADVPDYFRRVISMSRTGTDAGKMLWEPHDRIAGRDPTQTGSPIYYDRVGETFAFWPPTAATVSLHYERSIPTMSADGDTNWLLTKHPDAYLYESLVVSAPWLKEDERLVVWRSLADAAIEEINRQDRDEHGDGVQVKPSVMVV